MQQQQTVGSKTGKKTAAGLTIPEWWKTDTSVGGKQKLSTDKLKEVRNNKK
ncbi:hypothetical protein [Oceanimonas doudoroffii]|uniref:hypothetical protein n=1 Tax=Oceanimonas doudoroffii TaxID=84158 RepID=UPI00146AA827|nr:hypothetical protein [Oceanimonas doudoroffii]